MLSWGTIVAVAGGIKTVADAYGSVSGIIKGDGADRVVEELRKHRPDGKLQGSIDTLSQSIIKLNDSILYDQSWRGITDTTKAASDMADPRKALELLDPVQRALGGTILSSGLIEAPAKLQAAMAQNPTDIFDNVTPLNWAKPQTNSDLTPILFTSDGVRYVGWLRRGLLPFVLNCELHEFEAGWAQPQKTPNVRHAPVTSVADAGRRVDGSHAKLRKTPDPNVVASGTQPVRREAQDFGSKLVSASFEILAIATGFALVFVLAVLLQWFGLKSTIF
jgi:hypothetical protein